MNCKLTINIKDEMPTIDEARKKLIVEIDRARKEGIRILKIVHGWGSTGVGGRLRPAIRKSLSHRRKDGKVEDIIYGEKFNMFNKDIRHITDRYSSLRNDQDYNRDNEGITIAILTER